MKYVGSVLKSFRNISRVAGQEFRTLQWKGLKKLGKETVSVSTRQGRFSVYCADDAIGQQLFCNREFEHQLNKNVIRFLREKGVLKGRASGTILDIGANIGITCISMLKFGYFKNAIAIEPDPGNFRLLERNVQLNDLDESIICKQIAASSIAGEVPFEISESNFGDHRVRTGPLSGQIQNHFSESTRKVIKVPADTIDRILQDMPSEFIDKLELLWVDTQGHEGYVFQGAEKLLSRNIPAVVEITPYLVQRSGMAQKDFIRMIQNHWDQFFLLRSTRIGFERFIQFPISIFEFYYDAIGYDGDYEEVIFLKCDQR